MTKLWGCKDLDGTKWLLKSESEPVNREYFREGEGITDIGLFESQLSPLLTDVVAGEAREILKLDLTNMEIEFAPKPTKGMFTDQAVKAFMDAATESDFWFTNKDCPWNGPLKVTYEAYQELVRQREQAAK